MDYSILIFELNFKCFNLNFKFKMKNTFQLKEKERKKKSIMNSITHIAQQDTQ